MYKKGKVSLWLGNFKDEDSLQEFLENNYTDDGDSIASRFEEEFDIDYYDEDFLEMGYTEEQSNDLYQLLNGFSGDYKIIPEFIKIYNGMSYNSIVLLYDFEYDGSKKKYIGFDNQLDYISCVEYK